MQRRSFRSEDNVGRGAKQAPKRRSDILCSVAGLRGLCHPWSAAFGPSNCQDRFTFKDHIPCKMHPAFRARQCSVFEGVGGELMQAKGDRCSSVPANLD